MCMSSNFLLIESPALSVGASASLMRSGQPGSNSALSIINNNHQQHHLQVQRNTSRSSSPATVVSGASSSRDTVSSAAGRQLRQQAQDQSSVSPWVTAVDPTSNRKYWYNRLAHSFAWLSVTF
jgi:hypothetical protein